MVPHDSKSDLPLHGITPSIFYFSPNFGKNLIENIAFCGDDPMKLMLEMHLKCNQNLEESVNQPISIVMPYLSEKGTERLYHQMLHVSHLPPME